MGAREKKEKALNAHFDQMNRNIAANPKKWDEQFKLLNNGATAN